MYPSKLHVAFYSIQLLVPGATGAPCVVLIDPSVAPLFVYLIVDSYMEPLQRLNQDARRYLRDPSSAKMSSSVETEASSSDLRTFVFFSKKTYAIIPITSKIFIIRKSCTNLSVIIRFAKLRINC